MVVSYNECLRKVAAGSFRMYNIGENLTSDLIQANIGQKSYCPVVLVAHSFGGLVIKQLCVHAQKMLISESHGAKAKKFLDNIKGVFYYSTPHHGSFHIGKAKNVLYHSPLIEYFRIFSNEAAQLSHDFKRLRETYPKWQIKGIGESLPAKSGLFHGVVVVPEASAREGDDFTTDGKADHFNICKPDRKISRRFTALRGLLHSIADNSKEDARPENWQRLPQQVKGLDFRLETIKAKLKDCKMLGIVGMGGLGKTTLAKVAFNILGSAFEYTCFVDDVKFINGTKKDLKEAVWKEMHCDGKKAAEKQEWSKLTGRKLLLVLDDIAKDRELEVLLDIADRSSTYSRFIVTSRDHHLLKGLDYVYELPELDGNNSRQLFISHCFPNQMIIPVKLACHMEAIVEKCGGLPLTLEVVGKYLKLRDDEKHWRQTLEALDKAEVVSDLNEKVWAKLRPSYDGLEEKEQKMFLDAGTFFGNPHTQWKLRDALVAWSKAYETTSYLLWQTLVNRSLVYNVNEDENIQMHEQLKSLARRIASESSNNDMCRVWERTQAEGLLQNSNELHNKEYHAFQLINEDPSDAVVNVASSALQNLKKVQLLELDKIIIDETVADEAILNKLVLLKCVGLKVFNLALQSHLAILDVDLSEDLLPSSFGQLLALTVLTISNVDHQDTMPIDIGNLSKLERLSLKNWRLLQALPETFGKLVNLKYLAFNSCTALNALPESFGNLRALQHLDLEGCRKLEALPESFGSLSALQKLVLNGCEKLEALPKSFGGLSALQELSLIYCEKLKALPESFGSLSALQKLFLPGCGKLEALPESFGGLSALQELSLIYCEKLKALPESFGSLLALQKLVFNGCEKLEALPKSFGGLSSLQELSLTDCQKLKALPESFGSLSALQKLVLDGCEKLEALPECFGNLSTLEHLQLKFCYRLEALPECLRNLSTLGCFTVDCVPIEGIPDYIKSMQSMHTLELGRLPFVNELPSWLGDTGATPLALSHKTFGMQDGNFTLIREQDISKLYGLRGVILLVHGRAMKKTRASDYEGALADLCQIDLRLLEDKFFYESIKLKGFLLQERGIAKRFIGDMQGALEDLTAALKALSIERNLDHFAYNCWKHRGYVNFLRRDLDSAQSDGVMALRALSEGMCENVISPSLGEEAVTYLHFTLMNASRIMEEMDSSSDGEGEGRRLPRSLGYFG